MSQRAMSLLQKNTVSIIHWNEFQSCHNTTSSTFFMQPAFYVDNIWCIKYAYIANTNVSHLWGYDKEGEGVQGE